MTKFAESKFSVAVGSKAYRDNYDAVFGKKSDVLASLSEEEYAKLEPPTEQEIQAALDKGKREAERFEGWQDGYEDDDGTPRQG